MHRREQRDDMMSIDATNSQRPLNDKMSTSSNREQALNDRLPAHFPIFINDLLARDRRIAELDLLRERIARQEGPKQASMPATQYPQRVFSATLPALSITPGIRRSSRPHDLLIDSLCQYMEEAADGLSAGDLPNRGLLSAIRHSKRAPRLIANFIFYRQASSLPGDGNLLTIHSQIVLETLLDFLDLQTMPLQLEYNEDFDFPELRYDPPMFYPLNPNLEVHPTVRVDRVHPRVEVALICLEQPD